LNIFEFAITVIVISLSGALGPGPLLVATIFEGTKGGAKSGIKCAIGHTIIEFPLIILLSIGLLTIINNQIMDIITLLGGLALIFFGILTLRNIKKNQKNNDDSKIKSNQPLYVGILLTGLNPMFIIWWLTIGLKLISGALIFASLIGVLLMFVFHIWIDYTWLAGIAYLSKKGRNIINNKIYSKVLLIFSIIFMVLGIQIILSLI